jgi:exodeoxyribonuclease V gamma subunit
VYNVRELPFFTALIVAASSLDNRGRKMLMAGIHLVAGNRVERLVKRLIEVLEKPFDDPFLREVIVIQSQGMEQWLSQRIADYRGICANIRFYYPNSFIDEAFIDIFGDHFKAREFSRDVLTWKIIGTLPLLQHEPAFSEVGNYLRETDSTIGEVKLYQLSKKIAYLFDQYLTYRPSMMAGWASGGTAGLEQEQWQMMLWKKILETGIPEERKNLLIPETLYRKINEYDHHFIRIPPRISIFCISALPAHHMRIINALAAKSDIYFFVLNPCQEYWFDMESPKQQARSLVCDKAAPASYEENPLLASMGKAGREFFRHLYDTVEQEESDFTENRRGTLLCAIQNDILHLRGAQSFGHSPLSTAEDDDSIQFHSCHSPFREIEVLHDYMLSLFDRNDGIAPRDIVVAAPSIDRYAPYIEAVFSDSGIPFSIAQSSILSESAVITTFIELLELYFGRLQVSQVLSLIEKAVIREPFGLSDEDIKLIKKWVRETNIRWGIDSAHRERLALPEYAENTWRAGFDRMLMGYAIPEVPPEFVEKRHLLPYAEIEGSRTVPLGNFIEFVEKLSSLIVGLGETRTLDGWSAYLKETVSVFFRQSASHDLELRKLVETIDHLGGDESSMAALSGFDAKVSFDVIFRFLKDCFSSQSSPYGFLRGGVTFAEFHPLKSIPAKVLCLIGMNFDAFPKQASELCYDLMACKPHPGDRNSRDNDRYLFLEALLSAREKLYISYVGQSIIDNAPAPPSIVVSELQDYIASRTGKAEGRTPLERLTFTHRLHGFSPVYFRSSGRLYSYSRDNLKAAQEIERYLQASPGEPAIASASQEAPLPLLADPDKEFRAVDIDQLIGFFKNPARFFAQKRLSIYLDDETLPVDDELFALESLDRYQVATDLIALSLEDSSPERHYLELRARGAIPPGCIGRSEFEMIMVDLQPFVDRVKNYITGGRTGERRIPLPDDMTIGDFKLTGDLSGLFDKGIVEFSYSSFRAKYYIAAWIKHLVLNIMKPEGIAPFSYCITRRKDDRGREHPEVCSFAPLKDEKWAPARLLSLLELYWQGLKEPLPFFPNSSLAFVERFVKDGSRDEAASIQGAEYTWDNDFMPEMSEKNDPYFRMFFRDRDPLKGLAAKDFMDNALTVFEPLLNRSSR